MKENESFLLFCVENGRYALSVTAVERIVFAAEVTPLSDAPETVLGLINVEGEIMPVVDVRRRLGFPLRDMELSDRFILTRAIGTPLALLVDAVEGVVDLPIQAITAGNRADSWFTTAAVGDGGSIVVIQNVESFVSADDLAKLENNVMDANE